MHSYTIRIRAIYEEILQRDVCVDIKWAISGLFLGMLRIQVMIGSGQVSINISKPGITKGQHWHNTKWEFFIVVAGHGLIQMRKLDTDEVIEFEVDGNNIQCVHMLPGYTHNIINLSETENLVTVMYCNEIFNPNKPDTFYETV